MGRSEDHAQVNITREAHEKARRIAKANGWTIRQAIASSLNLMEAAVNRAGRGELKRERETIP